MNGGALNIKCMVSNVRTNLLLLIIGLNGVYGLFIGNISMDKYCCFFKVLSWDYMVQITNKIQISIILMAMALLFMSRLCDKFVKCLKF